ncbi:MAG TPA: hypothetical protein PKE06_28295, partial [Flavilitoribacter sp.]|nr:hypothetical protein [Flavilitoribacter sp.]
TEIQELQNFIVVKEADIHPEQFLAGGVRLKFNVDTVGAGGTIKLRVGKSHPNNGVLPKQTAAEKKKKSRSPNISALRPHFLKPAIYKVLYQLHHPVDFCMRLLKQKTKTLTVNYLKGIWSSFKYKRKPGSLSRKENDPGSVH